MFDANTLVLLGQFGFSDEAAEAVASYLLVLTALTVIAAVPTAFVARRKGRSVAFWLILALSIPILPLVVAWLLPSAKKSDGNSWSTLLAAGR
jgi:hypothetical protein